MIEEKMGRTPEQLFQELTDEDKCLNRWYRCLVFLIPGRLPGPLAGGFKPFRFVTVEADDSDALATIKSTIARGGTPFGIVGFRAIDPGENSGLFERTIQLFDEFHNTPYEDRDMSNLEGIQRELFRKFLHRFWGQIPRVEWKL